jgi:hypothetical protein
LAFVEKLLAQLDVVANPAYPEERGEVVNAAKTIICPVRVLPAERTRERCQ